MRRLIFLALAGCSSAYTAEAPSESLVDVPTGSVYGSGQEVENERMAESSTYNAQGLESAALHLHMLPDAERRAAVDAMGHILGNCPYTRARVMVLLTLEQGLSGADVSTLSPEGQQGVAEILREVRAINAFVAAADGDALPTPRPQDYLATTVETVDGPTFVASDRPIALSYEAIAQIDAAVESMPTAVQDDLAASLPVIAPHLGDRIAWHFAERHTLEGLRRLNKTEAALPPQLALLLALTEELSTHGC